MDFGILVLCLVGFCLQNSNLLSLSDVVSLGFMSHVGRIEL